MPISGSVTVDELIAEILKLDKGSVVTALQAQAQPIFQSIFDKGHAAATARFNGEKSELEGKITGLNETIRTKDTQIQQLSEKAPEVATLTQQHQTEINRLKEEQKNALRVANETLIGERRSRARGDLRVKLVGLGVDSDYAEMLVNKPDMEKRIRPNAQGQMEFIRADNDAPYAPAQGKDVLDLMAEELKAVVPPKFITVSGDRGSGTRSADSGSGGGKGAAGKYEAARTDVTKKEERASTSISARDRLAGRGVGKQKA